MKTYPQRTQQAKNFLKKRYSDNVKRATTAIARQYWQAVLERHLIVNKMENNG